MHSSSTLPGSSRRKTRSGTCRDKENNGQQSENDIHYFRKILNDESERFANLIHKWRHTQANESASINSEAQGDISTAIGLAQLLIDQRFKQFSSLIDDCEFKRGDKPIHLSDLQGFWDMVYYQVEDINRKFDALDKLKANDWVVPTRDSETPRKQMIPRKKLGSTKKSKASVKSQVAAQSKSNFSKFRAQVKQKTQEKIFDGVFFQVKSPAKLHVTPRSTSGKCSKTLTSVNPNSDI